MKTVQLEAVGWAFLGAALVLLALLLPARPLADAPPAPACLAALAYLVVSNGLVLRGLQRRRSIRFGPANTVTATRSTLVAVITGLVVASFTGPIPVALLVALIAPALALDAIDGWVARRTGTVSELGARFDMEVDAFLLLVLSLYVAESMGLWVLGIGALRYLFVMAGWGLPWFRRRLPPRYWRKVVTAAAGVALAIAASGLVAGIAALLVAAALLLLLESFGRDVVWLVRRRRDAHVAPAAPRVRSGSLSG